MKTALLTDRRSRGLLTGYFLGLGVVMAIWGARMPAVQQAAHLNTAHLALVLLAAALGMVAGLQAGGRLAQPERLPALLTRAPPALPDASPSWAGATACRPCSPPPLRSVSRTVCWTWPSTPRRCAARTPQADPSCPRSTPPTPSAPS